MTTPDGSRTPRGLAAWLSAAAPPRAAGEVTIALVSDRRVRALNRVFRGKNRTTDVLSFPAGADPLERAPRYLGDIVIATGIALRQAGREGHSFSVEIKTLALHGLLHLLGYDHDADTGAMARLEERLRARAGLRTSLIARTTQAARSTRSVR